jgi:hypothetical protein
MVVIVVIVVIVDVAASSCHSSLQLLHKAALALCNKLFAELALL